MSNPIKKVAIVGISGNSGSFITKSLLATGKHTVTAITRADSRSEMPQGVEVAKVDYDDPATIVNALKGQDALVITLGVGAPKDTQPKLIQAAIDANVRWVLPNEWSPDTANEDLARDVINFGGLRKTNEWIESLGKISYIAVTCGFWYEWSLSIPDAYGFDIANKKVTFFDDGDVKMSTSTWPQVGRGVAALLSLPAEELEKFRNKHLYFNSFTVSQQDMLDSILRVTNGKPEDWAVTKEPATERYAKGVEAMKKGDRSGFVKMMYTRVFYPDGSGDYETLRGTSNELLGLPKEDLDEATKAAIKRAEESPWGYKGEY